MCMWMIHTTQEAKEVLVADGKVQGRLGNLVGDEEAAVGKHEHEHRLLLLGLHSNVECSIAMPEVLC